MKYDISVFLVAICVLAIIGIMTAFVGIIASTVRIMRESVPCGIVCIFLDLFLISLIGWAIECGVIKPLKENKKNEK